MILKIAMLLIFFAIMIFVGVYGYIFGRIDIVEKYPDE